MISEEENVAENMSMTEPLYLQELQQVRIPILISLLQFIKFYLL